MELSPVDGVERRLEELLRRILLADVLLVELMLTELLDEVPVPGLEVLFGVARVVYERLVLQKTNVSTTSHHVATDGSEAATVNKKADGSVSAALPAAYM